MISPQVEQKKRRRELWVVLSLVFVFLFLTWVELWLFRNSQNLPYEHSVFFFGLVNFNIIVFLLLFFLIFRNVVKTFSETSSKLWGKTLKTKLIAAFVLFSFVPTTLMFFVSVFYINNSFDRWFSEKMSGVLKSSLEISNSFYITSKKRNYHFAQILSRRVESQKKAPSAKQFEDWRKLYSVDAIEYYPSLLGARVMAIGHDLGVESIPNISLEVLRKGVIEKAETSTVHPFDQGNLVRVVVPVIRPRGANGAIVVSSYLPLSLTSQIDVVAQAVDDFRDSNPLEYPLKSIYLIILVLMTLTILLGATWFGFYLAKQLSVPLEELTLATDRVANRDYSPIDINSGSQEMNDLIDQFNRMMGTLQSSERALSERKQYIEVVLSNVSTAVVSTDMNDVVTTFNTPASDLLGIPLAKAIGKRADEVLPELYLEVFRDLSRSLLQHGANRIQKEIRLESRGRSLPLLFTLSLLYDLDGKELGKILVLEDLTLALQAQRSAAWTEVARRIAHEIKNPLTPIQLAAERLERKFSSQITDSAFSESLKLIREQVVSLTRLVNEFSQFARLPKSTPIMGQLHPTIERVLSALQESNPSVRIEMQFDPELPSFRFDPEQIQRVVTNLVNNSISAVEKEENPKVRIETQYEQRLKLVRVIVSDNGIGIPENIRDRVFEPYVTTKEHGTGLGLAIVKKMIEDHQGSIRVFANEKKGTKFIVELPVLIEPQVREEPWVRV